MSNWQVKLWLCSESPNSPKVFVYKVVEIATAIHNDRFH